MEWLSMAFYLGLGIFSGFTLGHAIGFVRGYERAKVNFGIDADNRRKPAPMPAAPEPVSKPDAYCACGHSQSVHSRASGECYWVAYVAFDKPNLRCKCKSFKNAAAVDLSTCRRCGESASHSVHTVPVNNNGLPLHKFVSIHENDQ